MWGRIEDVVFVRRIVVGIVLKLCGVLFFLKYFVVYSNFLMGFYCFVLLMKKLSFGKVIFM